MFPNKTRNIDNKSRVLPRTLDPSFNLTMNGRKRFVILVTSYRSGSTFLGKLFDENPRVQYLFEPLHTVSVRKFYDRNDLLGAKQRHTDSEISMLYLQQIFHNCSVFSTAFYEERWNRCGDARENQEIYGTDDCPHRRSVSQICNYRSTTVLKEIRLRKLSDLLLINDVRAADVRIVHYTRHPLGVMSSRVGGGRLFNWNKKTTIESGVGRARVTRLAWEAYNYCSEATEIQRLLERDPWLKASYLYVTHQQLSLDPVKTTKKIYNHVGLDLSSDLLEFVKNTTTGKADDSQDQAQLMTSRVSKNVVFSWKDLNRMEHDHVRAIETVCSRLLGVTQEGFSFDPLSLEPLLQIFYPDS